jgi:hypothetical protein
MAPLQALVKVRFDRFVKGLPTPYLWNFYPYKIIRFFSMGRTVTPVHPFVCVLLINNGYQEGEGVKDCMLLREPRRT